MIEALPVLNQGVDSVRPRNPMNREVFTVLNEDPLTDVIRLMVGKGVKRLVVVDSEKRLLGIIDREVVMRALAG